MSQHLQDFRKDKRTGLVESVNPDYYQQIKDARQRQKEMNELHQRIDRLEGEVNRLKELIRNKLVG